VVSQTRRHLLNVVVLDISMQLGLATLLLTIVAPLGGALSFKKLGMINMLPDYLHGTVKFAHRKV
jgi:hypothetical protein